MILDPLKFLRGGQLEAPGVVILVVPAESCVALSGPEQRYRSIAPLQQKPSVLEVEIAKNEHA